MATLALTSGCGAVGGCASPQLPSSSLSSKRTNCPAWECPRNAARLNEGIVVDALDLDGEVLLPHLRTSPGLNHDFKIVEFVHCNTSYAIGSGAASRLRVLDGELVLDGGTCENERDPEKAKVGDKLILQNDRFPSDRYTIEISRIVRVRSWARGAKGTRECDLQDQTSVSNPRCYSTAYELTIAARPSGTDGHRTTVCDADVWGAEYWEGVDLDEAGGESAVVSWSDRGTYALFLTGELYSTKETAVVTNSHSEKPDRWLNIACAGSAMAKMRLLGYNAEIADKNDEWFTTWQERQATLRMITARYCENPDMDAYERERNTRTFTVDGTPLAWQNPKLWYDPWNTNANVAGFQDSVEAFWSHEGATCLTTPRLAYRENLVERKKVRDAIVKACGAIPECPPFLPRRATVQSPDSVTGSLPAVDPLVLEPADLDERWKRRVGKQTVFDPAPYHWISLNRR